MLAKYVRYQGCGASQAVRRQLEVPLLSTLHLGQSNLFRKYGTKAFGYGKEANAIGAVETTISNGKVLYDKEKEVVLYFDAIFLPSTVSFLTKYLNIINILEAHSKQEIETQEVKDRITRLCTDDGKELPKGIELGKVVPLRRDNGAFAIFRIPSGSTANEVEETIIGNVKKKAPKGEDRIFRRVLETVWRPYSMCYKVRGTPWAEDLNRLPSRSIRVTSSGRLLPEEDLYSLFRRYGWIRDIVPASDPSSFTTVIFQNLRAAIAAKICLSGIELDDGKTIIQTKYAPKEKSKLFRSFVKDHPRISLPIIFALLATAAVLIFDPIRKVFIEQKITQRYSLENLGNSKYLKLFHVPYVTFLKWFDSGRSYLDEKILSTYGKQSLILDQEFESLGKTSVWSERLNGMKQLRLWFYENVNTFVIVKGPKGSGKQFVVDYSVRLDDNLKDRILFVDCKPLVAARSDNNLIEATAEQLGYFPVFTWINSVSQFIDLAVQGLTGQKSGLSESKETQIRNMLLLTSQVLRSTALSDYKDYKKEAQRVSKRNKSKGEMNGTLAEGEEILKEDAYLQQHPDAKPIVIIDNFQGVLRSKDSSIFKDISEWCASLIQSNIAHVVFITSDVGSVQLLNDALPNQVFKTITLSDASEDTAMDYVLKQLSHSYSSLTKKIDSCIKPLGGRMLDLQAFVRRVKSSEDPDEALKEMIAQASEQITTFFLSSNAAKNSSARWNISQVWAIMKMLSENEQINYQDLIKNSLFKSEVETLATLDALEKNDLISLRREKGILSSINTGRPLYKAAFKDLVKDKKIFKLFETRYYSDLISIENGKISKAEEEIQKVSHLSDLKVLKARLDYLQSKITSSTETIVAYEKEIKEIDDPNFSIFKLKFS